MEHLATPWEWGDIVMVVNQVLDRHDMRRRYSTPTVSVLVGPLNRGGLLWRRWAQSKNRQVVSLSTFDDAERRWLTALCSQQDLTSLALKYLAFQSDQEETAFQSQWCHKTRYEREQFWQAVYKHSSTLLLRTLCDLAASGDTLPPDELATRLLEPYDDPFAGLRDLGSILRPMCPVETWPALLLQPDAAADVSWLVNTAPVLTQ